MRSLAPLLILCTGCDLFGTVRPPAGRPVSEAYGGGHELRVLDVASPIRAQQKIPVLSTPEVLAAYVPAHAEGEVLFGDHWIYVKLRDSEWFVDRLREPEPPANGEAAPESLRPLRDLEWSRVVVPHKN